MAQDVHVADDAEEGQQREDDVVFHHLGIRFLLVGALVGKHERFVGEAEGLRDDDHDHRYLDGAAVNAQLRAGLLYAAVVEIGEDER